MTCAFIDDGLILDGFLAANEVHPEVRFKYRPMTRAEFAKFNGELSEFPKTPKGTDSAELIAAQHVAAHLREWNILDRGGNPVRIEANSILRLQPVLAGRLLQIVRGVDPGDRLPPSE